MSNILIETNQGNIKIKLLPESAPKTCETISKLVQQGHYDGCCFYRAEPGFVIQGGLRMANGKVKKSPFGGIPLEYNLPNKRGTVTLARWDKPDTGDSEFFVMSHIVFPSLVNSKVNLNDNTNLDRSGSSGWALGFAVWGLVLALFSITGNAFQVVEGMDVCNRIAALPTQVSGGLKMLTQPVTFNKISLVN